MLKQDFTRVKYRGIISTFKFRAGEPGGFFVAKFLPRDERVSKDLKGKEKPVREFTICGNLNDPEIETSILVEILGKWEVGKYGHQFAVKSIYRIVPKTEDDLIAFFRNGFVTGISDVYGRRLIEYFGHEDLIRVLDEEPHRLMEVSGFGESNTPKAIASWKKQRARFEINRWTSRYGIPVERIQPILDEFGADAHIKLNENPYQLRLIHKIGLAKIEEVGKSLGLPNDSVDRAMMHLKEVLKLQMKEGHSCLAQYDIDQVLKGQGISEPTVKTSVDILVARKELKRHIAGDELSRVYLSETYDAETLLVKSLSRLIASSPRRKFTSGHLDLAISVAERKLNLMLSETQKSAVRQAFLSPVSILTGTPGSGKTTTTRVLVQVAKDLGLRFQLSAPTGRAARRMSELTNENAQTIHRLLEWSPTTSRFTRNYNNPISGDLLVCDEFSMVDLMLAASYFDAVPFGSSVVIVGDPDQLPAVGPGKVLTDLIDSRLIPVTKLTEIFRQAAKSLIVQNAHRINRGEYPQFFPFEEGKALRDCYCMYVRKTPDNKVDHAWIRTTLKKVITERIPKRFGLDPIKDVQVIIPMKTRDSGTFAINEFLQSTLNPRPKHEQLEIVREKKVKTVFHLGDRVLVRVNIPRLNLSNGDIGFVRSVDKDVGMTIEVEGQVVEMDIETVKESLQLAYASTIHKSQGSEFPAVIVLILGEHYVMLQRNLLYTAVTRARNVLLFIADRDAMKIALDNTKVEERNSLLTQRLRAANALKKEVA